MQAARQAGVDGVLVVDYPPEEMDDFSAALDAAGISPIFLLAPTTTEARMQAIGRVARGYAYYVRSRASPVQAAWTPTTSPGAWPSSAAISARCRLGSASVSAMPTAPAVSPAADAVVIGSKLIETMEQAVADVPPAQQTDAAIRAASLWLGGIRAAMDQVKRERAPA